MVFQYLHKGIETAELGNLKQTLKSLGDLNFHLYEVYKIIEGAVKNIEGGASFDYRETNADLRGHLSEAERLLHDLEIISHNISAELEKVAADSKKLVEEEKAFFEQITVKYNVLVGQWERRANAIEISDLRGHNLTTIIMPNNLMGFRHPQFKQTFEDLLVAYLHRNGLLVPGKSSRGFDIEYNGDSLERLHGMGVHIDGAIMRTPRQEFNLNTGTPTEKIIFSPYGKWDVYMECKNIKGIITRFMLHASDSSLEQIS